MRKTFPAVNPDAVRLDGVRAPYPPAPGVLVALQDCATGALRETPQSAREVQLLASRAFSVSPGRVYAAPGGKVLELLCRTLFFACRTVSSPSARPRGAVALCSPDPDTGAVLEKEEVAELCSAGGSTVLVDERLRLEESGLTELLPEHENLVLLRSIGFTHGLLGVNIAFALCSRERVQALIDQGGGPDRPALRAAAAAFSEEEYAGNVRARLVESRESLRRSLEELGFACPPTPGVFLTARHARARPARLRNELSRRGIEIALPAEEQGGIKLFLGTEPEHTALLYALKDILRA